MCLNTAGSDSHRGGKNSDPQKPAPGSRAVGAYVNISQGLNKHLLLSHDAELSCILLLTKM